PPLVSSSSPPGAWATPSRLRNSLTTTLRMSISFRSGSLGGRRRCAAKVIGAPAPRGVAEGVGPDSPARPHRRLLRPAERHVILLAHRPHRRERQVDQVA